MALLPTESPCYIAPAWLPGGHLQTIYPALCIAKPAVAYRRERWLTPDADFIDIDFIDGEPGKPFIVLFHGLEGSSKSHYARALMALVQQLGWSGAVPHFRGCSGELNHAPRFYHSGDAAEVDWIVRRFRRAIDRTARTDDARVRLVGAIEQADTWDRPARAITPDDL
jgi:predicted alpha/beta-fold hydrolase